jgi:hypothetical protein
LHFVNIEIGLHTKISIKKREKEQANCVKACHKLYEVSSLLMSALRIHLPSSESLSETSNKTTRAREERKDKAIMITTTTITTTLAY